MSRSGVHAFVYLAKQLFHHASAVVGAQHVKRGAGVEALPRLVQPSASLIDIAEDGYSLIEDADQPGELVGLVRGEPLLAGATMLRVRAGMTML